MADEIKLTLNPFGDENASAAAAAQEAAAARKPRKKPWRRRFRPMR